MYNKPYILGFGMIEVVVALGIFAVVGVTGITMVTHSFSVNRLGDEQTIATNLATQGLEITRGIRSQGWGILGAGSYGLQKNAGIWSFSPSPETWDKYTRTIVVSNGQRDGSGNIVDSGGSVDSDLKKITSTVTFNTSPTRHNSVVLVDYLTNYSKNIPTNSGEGIVVYGDTTTTPKWRYYTNSTDLFSSEANTIANESAFNIIVKTSPLKSEAIAAYTSSAGTLHVLCYNGSSWSEDWSVSAGGTGTTRRFDVTYENTTGKAMVVYSTNSANTNELAYRTKPNSSNCGNIGWTAAINLDPVRTSGIVQWVKLASDNRTSSNILGLIWADSASDLSAMLWNGSSWVNEPTAVTEASLEVVTVAQDVEDFDLQFESVSGNLMLIWSNSGGGNSVRYRRCTGGTATCTWGAVTTPPTFADDATNLTLAADPGSNNMVFASIGNNQSDLQIGYWNGTTSAWTNTANVDTSCTTPVAGRQKIAAGFLRSGATVRSVVMYDDQGAGNIGWYVGNAGVFTLQTDFVPTPTFANNQGYYQFDIDPKNSDRGIFIVADNSNDLFGKRLVMNATPTFSWSNSDSSTALELNLSQVISSPYNFAYWRN
ncbi:MAG: hypothetical protein WCL07_02365 [bacterium]